MDILNIAELRQTLNHDGRHDWKIEAYPQRQMAEIIAEGKIGLFKTRHSRILVALSAQAPATGYVALPEHQ